MGRSWAVELPSDIPFNNPRGAHVETEEEGLAGRRVCLGARSTRQMGPDVAVMYEVVGVKNGRHQAHMTTYFGDAVNAWAY